MANQGAKKRKEENARHISKLFKLIVACNDAYFLFLLHVEALDWAYAGIVGLCLSISTTLISKMATPSYDNDGELLDGGFDMSPGGICGYMHDVIYITSFVQITSILSDKFWYTYLVIPGFAIYQASGFIKGFLSQGSEVTRKTLSRHSRKKSVYTSIT